MTAYNKSEQLLVTMVIGEPLSKFQNQLLLSAFSWCQSGEPFPGFWSALYNGSKVEQQHIDELAKITGLVNCKLTYEDCM
jgi:hypothetical protein